MQVGDEVAEAADAADAHDRLQGRTAVSSTTARLGLRQPPPAAHTYEKGRN